jgi:cellulose biosynthesis protein BcsQ
MKEHKNIIKELEKAVGEQRVLTPIRKDFKLSTSFLQGKPIAYIDRRCRGTRDYKKLALDILEKL